VRLTSVSSPSILDILLKERSSHSRFVKCSRFSIFSIMLLSSCNFTSECSPIRLSIFNIDSKLKLRAWAQRADASHCMFCKFCRSHHSSTLTSCTSVCVFSSFFFSSDNLIHSTVVIHFRISSSSMTFGSASFKACGGIFVLQPIKNICLLIKTKIKTIPK
jgi:hypothetical protein